MSVPMRFLAAAIAATGLLTLANGCGSSGGGGATPEETFKNATAAREKEDWKAFCGCMTKDSQDMFAGGIAMGGMMAQAFAGLGGDEEAEKGKAIAEAMKKHGLTDEYFTKLQEGEPPKDELEMMKKVLEPVEDRPQFIADVMAAMKKMKDYKDETPVTKDSTLKDVKIDGDSAKGTIEFERDGEKKSETIAFKKVDGKWLMDMTDMMKKPEGDDPNTTLVPRHSPAGEPPTVEGGGPAPIRPGDTPGDTPTEDFGDGE